MQVPPSIFRVHSDTLDKDYEFHVQVKRFLLKELPEDEEKLSQWLIERFKEKDQFIKEMKENWLNHITLIDQ